MITLPNEAGQGAISASNSVRLPIDNGPTLPDDNCFFEQHAGHYHCTRLTSAGTLVSDAWPSHVIKNRFGLSAALASVVVTLAGIGPQEGAR